jgi:Domain of unknown function (DUF4279)
VSEDASARPWYAASLRVSSEDWPLSELTERLGKPSRGRDEGDLVTSEKEPGGPAHSKAVWLRDSGLDSAEPLEKHIEALLGFAEEHANVLAELGTRCALEMYCGVLCGDEEETRIIPAQDGGSRMLACGFNLSAKLMRRLSALGIALCVDVG